MHHEQQDVMRAEAETDIALDQFESVHDHLQKRLCRELRSLQDRVDALRQSPTAHSASIVSTYERLIRKKRAFMEQWGMDTSCSRH
ncbi:hypothetical protein [Vreelandella utahensis]|uniref:hypothetical protein n=1 Tax=Vreelandella halophila TaxID=86177 RepID=UPI0009870496|nr:hypothetical protein [Halomonas utahensis]